MSTPEISDDDESFEEMQLPKKTQKVSKPQTIEISDDSNETIIDQEELTSDEESQLPEVSLQHTMNERDKIIKNLFPVSRKEQPQPTTSVQKPKEEKGHVKMIGGVSVNFPVPPYGAQIALMSKVIQSINKKVNCLLESPTGSGKTLALLCGALAWQRHERNRISSFQAQQFADTYPELKDIKGAVETIGSPPPTNPEFFSFTKAVFGEKNIYDKTATSNSQGASPSSAAKRMEPYHSNETSPADGMVTIHKKRRIGDSIEVCTTPECRTPEKQSSPAKPETPNNIRVPTIYYGARTHKQIQQVVREFSKTVYCGEAKMTILSSREYSCVRPFDRNLYSSKNDMCRECIKKVKTKMNETGRQESTNCKFYENRKELNWKTLPPAFDLDDLVAGGREIDACPFFAARLMVPGAQIVFCPYNYLIDPSIRNSLQIELRDEIVILDEAHNIEDICREAATFTFTRDHILAALKELEYLSGYTRTNRDISSEVGTIIKSLNNWNYWFGNQMPFVANKPVNNNEATHCLNVDHFVKTLHDHNIGVQQYAEFQGCVEAFSAKLRDDPSSMYGITQSTASLLESISTVLGYLFRNDGKEMDDFKPALIRTVSFESENFPDAHGWRSSQYEKKVSKEALSLRVMCLSPAAVFASLRSSRCILLSSGTLTPLISLHSELAADFPLTVSPNHVVPRDRVWIGTLTTCPDGSPLECKSQATNQVATQDAIGAAVLWTCQVTPNGVLCFVPSYQLMFKLQKRWRETGLWRKLGAIKNIFMESRNVKDHNEVMDDFYQSVATSKGALLFAVYRGKVSEGMDFKDEQARAVITIGIPYPNTYDLMVKEKMLYNDRHTNDKKLLRSNEWLKVQAYRALNQAIGRCVRHCKDWGAVLLIDSRFTQPCYTEHLSKWVRAYLGNNHHTFESLTNSDDGLESFMQSMTIKETEDMDIS